MYIELKAPHVVGEIQIEMGRYLASIETDLQRIRLTGRGVTHLLPAKSRPSKRKVRTTEMSFQPSLGPDQFVLLFRVPPQKEWFSILTRVRGPGRRVVARDD